MAAPVYNYPGLPDAGGSARDVARSVNLLLAGKSNNVGELTLNANATTTTLTDARLTETSHIDRTPLTLNAAAALAGMYVSARAIGSATITHANTAAVDKTFSYAVIG